MSRSVKGLTNLFSFAKYYDINSKLSDNEFKSLIKYIRQHSDNMVVFEHDNTVFIADLFMLKKRVNLNCFYCENRYGCCGGSPCKMSDKAKRYFNNHAGNIVDLIRDSDYSRYNDIIANGGFIKKNGSITEYDGRCSFLVEEDGIYKCAIRKYASDNSISKYDICSLSCLLFPLEIIRLYGYREAVYFITSIADMNVWDKIGRWENFGRDENMSMKCLFEEQNDSVFGKRDYRPVYMVQRELIEHEFGVSVYELISKHCREIK